MLCAQCLPHSHICRSSTPICDQYLPHLPQFTTFATFPQCLNPLYSTPSARSRCGSPSNHRRCSEKSMNISLQWFAHREQELKMEAASSGELADILQIKLAGLNNITEDGPYEESTFAEKVRLENELIGVKSRIFQLNSQLGDLKNTENSTSFHFQQMLEQEKQLKTSISQRTQNIYSGNFQTNFIKQLERLHKSLEMERSHFKIQLQTLKNLKESELAQVELVMNLSCFDQIYIANKKLKEAYEQNQNLDLKLRSAQQQEYELKSKLSDAKSQASSIKSNLVSCNTQLSDKESNLVSCNTSLNAKKSDLVSCNTQLSDKELNLVSCNTQLSDKESNLVSCNTTLNAKESDLLSCNTQLNDKESNLVSCNTQLSNKESNLLSCNTQLVTKTSNLVSCNTQLNTKESNLVSCNKQLSTRELNFVSCKTQLNTKESNFVSCNTQLRTKESNLVTCQNQLCNTKSGLTMESLNGREYYFYTYLSSMKTWYEARDFCKQYCMELVTVDTREKNNALAQKIITYFEKSNYLSETFWIGLNDLEREGQFRWISNGAITSFTNWHSGEPNNDDQGMKEDCAEMIRLRNVIKWNDRKCSQKKRFICEPVY